MSNKKSPRKTPEVWLTARSIADAVEADVYDIFNRIRGWTRRPSEVVGAQHEYLCPPGWNARLRQEVAEIKRRPRDKPSDVSNDNSVQQPAARQSTPSADDVLLRRARQRMFREESIPRDLDTGEILWDDLKEMMIWRLMDSNQYRANYYGLLDQWPQADRKDLDRELNSIASRRNSALYAKIHADMGNGSARRDDGSSRFYSPVRKF